MILLAGRRAPCSSQPETAHIKPEICIMKTCKSKHRLGHSGIAISGTRVPIVSQVIYKGVKFLSSLPHARRCRRGHNGEVAGISLRQTTILILLPHRYVYASYTCNSFTTSRPALGPHMYGIHISNRSQNSNIPASGYSAHHYLVRSILVSFTSLHYCGHAFFIISHAILSDSTEIYRLVEERVNAITLQHGFGHMRWTLKNSLLGLCPFNSPTLKLVLLPLLSLNSITSRGIPNSSHRSAFGCLQHSTDSAQRFRTTTFNLMPFDLASSSNPRSRAVAGC
ncbi:hypothetical protein BDD12DRAFT_236936 [Trichophaea hybrida]|nr:hypothetical protein BDD12DRAFT_236936 [Trichophaea hybrida]